MNVSSLISPGITNTLASTGLPTAFGDQVVNQAKQKVVSAALGQLQILKQKLEGIIKRKTELEVTHKNNLKKLDSQYQPKPPAQPTLTEEEYNVAVAVENARYEVEKAALEEQQKQTEDQIQSITKDPKAKRKLKEKKYKAKLARNKQKNKAGRTKALKGLLTSVAKTIAPLLLYSGVRVAMRLARQNNSLQKLVDQTNEIIDNATTPEQLEQARVSRNAAYNILSNNEQNLVNIQRTLSIILITTSILQALLPLILASISFPGTPASAAEGYRKVADTLKYLNIALAILISILEPIIAYLNELKAQLRNVDNRLDIQTIDNSSLGALTALLNTIRQPKEEFYKGFKLVIKEDQDPRSFVKGSIKRNYAAALDRDGVEIVKSEYSYTLEPQVLIDQVKIIIDQQNLQI